MPNDIFAHSKTPGTVLYSIVRRDSLAWKPGTNLFESVAPDLLSVSRTLFVYQEDIVDANGDYGPFSLPGTGPNRRWIIYLKAGATPDISDAVVLDDTELTGVQTGMSQSGPMEVVTDSVDKSVVVRVLNLSGTPATDIAYNSPGIALWYKRDGAADVAITPANLSSTTDLHVDGGFIHIRDGYCRLDVPDAAFSGGAEGVLIGGSADGKVFVGTNRILVEWSRQAEAEELFTE